MIYVGLDVHKGFSRMGMFNPADGELRDLGNVRNEPSELAAQLAQVPEPKTVKNRLHLDLHLPRHEAAAKRDLLVSLGGTLVGTFETFWVLTDPEGNELCVCVDE